MRIYQPHYTDIAQADTPILKSSIVVKQLSPLAAVALKAKVTVSCVGWSPHPQTEYATGDLTYEFSYSVVGSGTHHIVQSGSQPDLDSFLFPPGLESSEHEVQIRIKVSDPTGETDFTVVSIQVGKDSQYPYM